MLLRLPKDAYPLSPELTQPKSAGKQVSTLLKGSAVAESITEEEEVSTTQGVQIFPLHK